MLGIAETDTEAMLVPLWWRGESGGGRESGPWVHRYFDDGDVGAWVVGLRRDEVSRNLCLHRDCVVWEIGGRVRCWQDAVWECVASKCNLLERSVGGRRGNG